ncbi:hypothetical protein L6R52_29050 [Myxococcota bacterium]|nr:hypothetical protein [Myxococcota bacterium]
MRLFTLKNLMTFSACIAMPYGLACVLFPVEWMKLMGGIEVTAQGILVARMYGGQVFGFGATSWLARNTPDSPAKRAVVRGFVVVDALSLVLAIWAQAAGVVGPEGLIDVAGFTFFVLAFGYFALFPERA